MKSKDERWKRIIEGGKKSVYDNILENTQDVIVDSSKTPFWVEIKLRD